MSFERVGGQQIWKGRIGELWVDRFRYPDGKAVERELVKHPGAVVILPFDGRNIWMVRQPREATGEQALLELPAGKLDVEGEQPLEAAKRELREEIGKSARDWKQLTWFYTTPGFSDEKIIAFLATGLDDETAAADEEERIEVAEYPVEQLDELIRDCHDVKSLATLLWFRAFEAESKEE